MANEEQLSILKQGVKIWNRWRKSKPGTRVDLYEADLRRPNINLNHFQRCNLAEGNLSRAILNGADLQHANFYRTDLSEAYLREADLRGANFRFADLRGADLHKAKLNEADFEGADLRGVHFHAADLTNARLYGANLMQANLGQANLHKADIRTADLREANLTEANLTGARLYDAHLFRAILINTDLTRADLTQANLIEANMSGANLSAANLSDASIGRTDLGFVNLSTISGLESVKHIGPSNLGNETIVNFMGRFPVAFLRGCGLSDTDIEYAKLFNPELSNEEINKILYAIYDLRAARALQISPLFVSYSHSDGHFVDKIGNSLTKKGIRYWRDIHDLKAGRIEKQVDRAIRHNATVLLVLSENSLRSDWVEHEVRIARELEKDLRRDVLCPIALDDSWKSSRWPGRLMEQIMEYNILDFSHWEDNRTFGEMFRRLIDGLELFYKG